MASIQCYGVKETLKAATNQRCAHWAIFDGKNLHFKYDTDEDIDTSMGILEEILTSMDKTMSVARYTLKFYEELKPGKKINNETPYNTSINFRLTQDDDEYHQRRHNYSYHKELQERIKALEEELAERDQEEEDNSLSGVLKGFLTDPQTLVPYVQAFEMIKGMFKGNPRTAASAASPFSYEAVGEVHRMGTTTTAENENGEVQRLEAALNKLQKYDPQIVSDLEILAEIAETNTGTFQYLLGMLRNMKK